jgi:hypothetical protein
VVESHQSPAESPTKKLRCCWLALTWVSVLLIRMGLWATCCRPTLAEYTPRRAGRRRVVFIEAQFTTGAATAPTPSLRRQNRTLHESDSGGAAHLGISATAAGCRRRSRHELARTAPLWRTPPVGRKQQHSRQGATYLRSIC